MTTLSVCMSLKKNFYFFGVISLSLPNRTNVEERRKIMRSNPTSPEKQHLDSYFLPRRTLISLALVERLKYALIVYMLINLFSLPFFFFLLHFFFFFSVSLARLISISFLFLLSVFSLFLFSLSFPRLFNQYISFLAFVSFFSFFSLSLSLSLIPLARSVNVSLSFFCSVFFSLTIYLNGFSYFLHFQKPCRFFMFLPISPEINSIFSSSCLSVLIYCACALTLFTSVYFPGSLYFSFQARYTWSFLSIQLLVFLLIFDGST
ncbi:unnamed protein product [Acanthosepion pharaonis]|uniref:Uncharacterized protein n=1 Tax=Acanthosepion pharaonis TaxID=158019 RepID=A0A812D0P9_ACAPH|nr:unnamed protein product [Sepia pharaonis]